MNKFFYMTVVALVMVASVASAQPKRQVQRNYHNDNNRQYQNNNLNQVYVTPAPSAREIRGMLPQEHRQQVVYVQQQERVVYVQPEPQVVYVQQTPPPVVVVRQEVKVTPEVMVLAIINSVIRNNTHCHNR